MEFYHIILLVDQRSNYRDITDQIESALSVPAELIKSFDIIDTVNRIVLDKIDLVIVDRNLLSKNDYRRTHYFYNKTKDIPVIQILDNNVFDELSRNDQLPNHFLILEQFSNNEISETILKALYDKLPKLNVS